MKAFFRFCLNQSARKHINEEQLNIRCISLHKDDISYFNLSSNPILSFFYDGKLYYFRQCPKRLNFKDYFRKAIDDFFSSLGRLSISKEHFKQEIPIKIDFSQSEIEAFSGYLSRKCNEKGFLKCISEVDRISIKTSFSIWKQQRYDSDFFYVFAIGDIPSQCHDIGVYFLWYMRGVCSTYRTLNIARSEEYSYFSASRSIASRMTAESIGIENMITSAELCRIELDDGSTMFGVISESAEGNRMLDAELQIDGSLQNELLKLNILDIICFQTDHGMNNYNVFRKDGKHFVCAFDNDNPNTFAPIPIIKHNFLGCSPIVDKRGLLNRPYFDNELYERLRTTDITSLKKKLKPYLNVLQITALQLRIKKITRMLEMTRAEANDKFISEGMWGEESVTAEMSGKYGRTYLTMLEDKANIRK